MSSHVLVYCFVTASCFWIFVNCNICDEPIKIGPCKARMLRYYFNKDTGSCKTFYWGGCSPNGNNFKTEKQCVSKCHTCNQSKKIGPCKARMLRYFFNTATNRCEKFYWGGCRPTGNNFKTEKQCNAVCSVCDQPKKAGPCKAYIPRYYFNKTTGQCKKFGWGGCTPNGNNFKTKEACKKTCKPFRTSLKLNRLKIAEPLAVARVMVEGIKP